MAEQQNPVRGIILMSSAVTLFTVMQACIKAVDRVPAGEAMFFRSALALPVVMAWLAWQNDLRDGIKTAWPWRHALRGIAGALAMGMGFAGLRFLPFPEATAIRFVTPVAAVVFAALILGERIRLVRITAVLVGLLGVVIITAPRFSAGFGTTAALGALLTLGSACMAALAHIFVKSMSGTEKTAAIVFYFSLTTTVVSLVTLPFGWVVPTPYELTLLVAAGLIGGVGQILLTASFRFADAGVVEPFTYISMLWSIIIGFFWFGELPTWQMLGGAALIILAGVAIVYRERHLGRKRTARGEVRATTLR